MKGLDYFQKKLEKIIPSGWIQSRSWVDGSKKKVKYTNILALCVVGLNSIITNHTTNFGDEYSIIYSVAYYVFAIIIFILPVKITPYTFLFIGLYYTSIGTLSNASGIIFFVFGFYMLRKLHPMILTGIIVLIIGVLKYTFVDTATISQLANMLIAYIWIFTIYYILMHPKQKPPKPKPVIIFCPHLDEIDIKIVEKLNESYIHKQIAPVVELKTGAVSRRISRMYNKLDVHSSAELVTKCLHMGYITQKVDNSAQE